MLEDIFMMIVVICGYGIFIYGILAIIEFINDMYMCNRIFNYALNEGDRYTFNVFGMDCENDEVYEVIGKEGNRVVYFNTKNPNKVLKTHYMAFLHYAKKIS